MKTTIKLDTGAMRALFLEGSKAEVELQNCVLANIAKATLNKQTTKQIEEAVRSVVRADYKTIQSAASAAHKNWLSSSGFSKISLSLTGQEAVKKAVNNKLAEEYESYINASIDNKVRELLDSVNIQREIERSVVRAVNNEIDKRVKAKMQDAIKALNGE